MPGILKTIGFDYLGLCRTCGPLVATRWLVQIATHLKQCKQEHNLQPADRAMGDGPFRCTHRSGATALLVGQQVLTGLREIWVRDAYLSGDFLKIPPNATVVDLGSNMGNFTLLALAHGPGVRVISIEPDPWHLDRLRRSLDINGWTDRVKIIQAFVGGITQFQQDASAGSCANVPQMTEYDLIQSAHLDSIDFLKCDIEGSEFGLLTPESKLLNMSRQIAIELHHAAGDWRNFTKLLESKGFEVKTHKTDENCATVYARRS